MVRVTRNVKIELENFRRGAVGGNTSAVVMSKARKEEENE